jgi:Putative Se/S carrier protein-like
MSKAEAYDVILFASVSYALRAEKILKETGIPFKLIPVPRHIGSDCGVCLRFSPAYRKQIEEALAGKVEVSEIRHL